LANALVLPAQPAVMVAGGLALLLGLVWAPLGQLAAALAWPFGAYTLAVIERLGQLAGASFYVGEVSPAMALAAYALLFGFTWLRARPAVAGAASATGTEPMRRNPWPTRRLAVLGASVLLVWGWYFSLPAEPARLRVTLLELAAGEAVLITPPGGAAVLVGGGPGGYTLAAELAGRLPLLATALDTLIVAAPGDDHLGGLPALLDRYHFRQAVLTQAPGRSSARGALLTRLNQAGVSLVSAADHPVLDLGVGIRLRALADTDQGSVWRLEWDRFSLLLGPGLDADAEAALLRQGLVQPATALLLAQGGASGANSAAWLAAVNPQVVLISVAEGNAAGNPTPDVLARLLGRNVLRTDRQGAITLETDGEQLWVTVER
jgi:competence protein ComEC